MCSSSEVVNLSISTYLFLSIYLVSIHPSIYPFVTPCSQLHDTMHEKVITSIHFFIGFFCFLVWLDYQTLSFALSYLDTFFCRFGSLVWHFSFVCFCSVRCFFYCKEYDLRFTLCVFCVSYLCLCL